jgi:hypothetical protein
MVVGMEGVYFGLTWTGFKFKEIKINVEVEKFERLESFVSRP